ncbi:GNAT family N-acetyltransferase [Bacillus spongiae]|uniref:GNAT family N-acetyltransferase n=1 Tax=Bacillus spongiae TaxID=2683610 RepID=A0ABU8HBN9_9BACI
MRDFENVMNKNNGFKVLNGLPNFIAIEEDTTINLSKEELYDMIQSVVRVGENAGVKRMGVHINKESNHYHVLSKLLRSIGFEVFASKIEVYRDLEGVRSVHHEYQWRSLGEGSISIDEFKHNWMKSMSDSDNTTSTLTMDEHIDSLKSELGEGWRNCCHVVYLKDTPIGISMPIIEPGTKNEGRLFYFGIVPEQRGKGHSALIHEQSLCYLKQLGATYYIGSTHEQNLKMQKVFWKNGCKIKRQIESYYFYFQR